MHPKEMEMKHTKKIVSKNFANKDEQEGQPGPKNEVGEVARPKQKPQIKSVEVIMQPMDEPKWCKPGPKSRKRVSTIPSETVAMDTSDADADFEGYRSEESTRSAVSGISYKSINSAKKIRVENDEYKNIEISSEDETYPDQAETSSQQKKNRGRPPTTGKGVLAREIRAQKATLEQYKKENAEAEKIARGLHDPADYRKTAEYDRMGELEHNIKLLPTRDIAAQLLESAKQIHGVAVKSSNLKGTMVKTLKEASLMVQVGVDIITGRTSPRESEQQREMETLREEVNNLRKELAVLRRAPISETNAPTQILENKSIITNVEIENEQLGRVKHSSRQQSSIEDIWPAIRPEIQGKRLVLSDPPRNTQEEKRTRAATSVNEQRDDMTAMETGFNYFLETMNQKIIDMFAEFRQSITHTRSNNPRSIKRGKIMPSTLVADGSGNRNSSTRYKPDTPAMRGSVVSGRPAPAKERKEEKEREVMTNPGNTTVSRDLQDRPDPTPWSQVVGRKAKKDKQKRRPITQTKTKSPTITTTSKATKRRRIPRTAAVVLTCPQGTYADTMREIREKISLTEVGINTGITTRTALTGALILEVPGPENGPKADALASRIREVVNDKTGVKVDRPTKTAEIRVKNLECSITEHEVCEAIAEKAECRIHEIQAGKIHRIPRGQSSLWLRIPLAVARRVTREGYIRVGWSRVQVELLDSRPLRCYRCLERGHVREQCTNPIDRSRRCYRCGGNDHMARNCKDTPKCPLCADLNRPHNHVLGGEKCAPKQRRSRQTNKDRSQPTSRDESEATGTRPEEQNSDKNLEPRPQRKLKSKAGKKMEEDMEVDEPVGQTNEPVGQIAEPTRNALEEGDVQSSNVL